MRAELLGWNSQLAAERFERCFDKFGGFDCKCNEGYIGNGTYFFFPWCMQTDGKRKPLPAGTTDTPPVLPIG